MCASSFRLRPTSRKAIMDQEEVNSQLVDAKIDALTDWRGEMLGSIRGLIKDADADVVEELKWRKPSNSMSGVPTWSHAGIICTGETYKDKVKMTFARGAAVPDPAGLFNSSLGGGTRRAIDFHEGDGIDEQSLKALIRAAVAVNLSRNVPTDLKRFGPAPADDAGCGSSGQWPRSREASLPRYPVPQPRSKSSRCP